MNSKLIGAAAACAVAAIAAPSSARAGVIADENQKPGVDGGWPVARDGTANGTGQCDLYPAQWSIATGDTVRLKIRSTTSYDLRVMRIGWYGGTGATQVLSKQGLPASPQDYVAADPTYGMVEAKWSDTVTIPTDASWTPGVYVARVEQPSGDQADTFFVLRDDGRARMPFVLVLATATHAAYDTWPGPNRGGKSLYGFNSSDSIPTDSPTAAGAYNQAVKVSFDRPFFVGGGTGDVGTWETPMLRFLEKGGWDVAYATDQDLNDHPEYFLGRKAIVFVGHSEYWSRPMFDHALAARDAGVNMLFATGNTLLWQIRFEAGAGGPTSTVVGFKTSWRNDPEQQLAYKLESQGDIEGAKPHYGLVTRLWKNLEYQPAVGIDERRSGMILTGVETAAAFSYWYPWADFVVREPSHWLFANTGMKWGDTIHGVMGYEIDSTKVEDPTFDPWRPQGQVRLATMIDKDGVSRGSSGYYVAPSGAEIVSLGAIAFSWALDSFASGDPKSVDPRAQQMITNVMTRWSTYVPRPQDAGVSPGGDGGASSSGDAGTGDASAGAATQTSSSTDSSSGGSAGGCACDESMRARSEFSSFALGAIGALAIALRRRATRA